MLEVEWLKFFDRFRQDLAEASPVIGELVKEGKLLVAGGVYDLNTGRVTPVAL